MPIVDYEYRDGIFYAREYGDITPQDAKQWANHARLSAAASQIPLVILVDSTEVTSIAIKARRIFAKASSIPNIALAAVAAGTPASSHEARMTASIAADPHTYIFATIEEAREFARQKALEYHQLHAGV